MLKFKSCLTDGFFDDHDNDDIQEIVANVEKQFARLIKSAKVESSQQLKELFRKAVKSVTHANKIFRTGNAVLSASGERNGNTGRFQLRCGIYNEGDAPTYVLNLRDGKLVGNVEVSWE